MDESWSDAVADYGGWGDTEPTTDPGTTEPTPDPGWLGADTPPEPDPVAEANTSYDTLMAVSGAASWANQGVTGTGSFAELPPTIETGGGTPPVVSNTPNPHTTLPGAGYPGYRNDSFGTGMAGVDIKANTDGTWSIYTPGGTELGRFDNQAFAQAGLDYMNTSGARNENFEYNYGDVRHNANYDYHGMPIWDWSNVQQGAPTSAPETEAEWNQRNPNYQRDTGWTPYWGYNEYLANQNPMFPNLEQVYGRSWDGIANAPSWTWQSPAGSYQNALTYMPPPVLPGNPDYDRMQRDITAYGEKFNVGGPSYTLPGGWMTMGPGGFLNTGEVALKEQNPSWYTQRMEGLGYVWNPYGGFFEQGYFGPAMGELGAGKPYAYQQATIPARRGGGGGGGGGGGYAPYPEYTPVPPLELKPGTPEYEAYFSRMPRINNVEWMPGR